MSPIRKGGLGKGLGALLGDIEEESIYGSSSSEEATNELLLADIDPNIDQPRKEFDDDALAALVESIKNHGVITP